MKFEFALCLPRDRLTVPVVRHILGSTLRHLGVDEEYVEDVELVVTEACTNVLRHAGDGGNEYEVNVVINESNVEIAVGDQGGGFDHELIGLEAAPVGDEEGRGVNLMRMLVDHLQFVSDPRSGTVVHLTKSLGFDRESLLGRLISAEAAPRPN